MEVIRKTSLLYQNLQMVLISSLDPVIRLPRYYFRLAIFLLALCFWIINSLCLVLLWDMTAYMCGLDVFMYAHISVLQVVSMLLMLGLLFLHSCGISEH